MMSLEAEIGTGNFLKALFKEETHIHVCQVVEVVGVPRYDVPHIHIMSAPASWDGGHRNSSHANMLAPASLFRPHAQPHRRPARAEQSLPLFHTVVSSLVVLRLSMSVASSSLLARSRRSTARVRHHSWPAWT
jgi:hypothetical protein